MNAYGLSEDQLLPLYVLQEIDQACDQFEAELQTDSKPDIEKYLRDAREPERSALLRHLLRLELDYSTRRGQDASIDDYQTRFPDHHTVISETFASFSSRPETVCEPSRSDQIDRYHIKRQIGTGGFGTVYLAEDTELRRTVAIKVPRPDSVLDVEHYLQEARTVAQLTHPSIVPVYDAGRQTDGTPFVVMQYVDGLSLEDLLKTHVRSPLQAAELICQVAEGVHHAHTQGFIHRDLKPSNILIDQHGRPLIADFGLALHEKDQHQHQGDTSGTATYRAPEQVRGQAQWMDGRSDIWSLGIILYELLTGRRPFATTKEIEYRDPKPPRQINDKIPASLESICLKCLAKNVENRFATADALANELRLFVDEASAAASEIQVAHDDQGNPVVSGRASVLIYQSGGQVRDPLRATSAEVGPNPYRGLSAFQEQDGHLFFGREAQIERLWEAFRQLQEGATEGEAVPRLLPILGPSGCGKSSLARAGLIAELARRPLPGWMNARMAVFTPGRYPLESLAGVLARIATGDPAPVTKARELTEELKRLGDSGDYDGLRRIAEMLPRSGHSPLIVLVDQFEEIYSLCDEPRQRDIFIGNLLHAVTDRSAKVSAVITLRSDFLRDTQDHQELNRLIAQQCILVPAMTDEELRRAIGEPAKRAQHPLDKATVDLLVGQTQGREGSLPLLQFALTRIWEGLAQGIEPSEMLQQIGGVGGALAGEAQRIYDGLNSRERKVARRAFVALVQLGEGTRDTRRRVPIDVIVSHRDERDDVHAILSKFSTQGARLITLSSERDGAETAEVTHEALFEHWETLKNWLDSSREDIRFHRRLDQAAGHWHQTGRPDGLLWRPPDLDLLRQFHQRAGDDLTPVQMEFFVAGDHKLQEEKRRQRRRVQLYQGAAILFALLGCVVAYLGYQSYQNQRRADANAEKLELAFQEISNEKKTADNHLVRLSISDGVGLMDRRDLLGAVSKFARALQLDQGDPSREQVHRMRLAAILDQCPKPVQIWFDKSTISYAELSPDGRSLATATRDAVVRVWDVASSGRLTCQLNHAGPIRLASFSRDSERIVTASSDGTARVWHALTGEPVTALLTHQGAVRHAAFSPDGRLVATASEDKTAQVWDAASGEKVSPPLVHQKSVNHVAFSPDGRFVVTASDDHTARIWDARRGEPLLRPLLHAREVKHASFGPQGRYVVTASDDHTARLWEVETGDQVNNPMIHHNWVRSATFSRDGRLIVTTSFDHTARLWNATTGRLATLPLHHDLAVNHASFSPDGQLVATASADGTARVWYTATGEPFMPPLRHGAGVSRVFFCSNRHYLMTVTQDGLVIVWNVGGPFANATTLQHRNWVMSASFSGDGKRVVTACMDGTARIWDVARGRPAIWPLVHSRGVTYATFGPRDQRIVTISADHLVRVWDAASGVPISSPMPHAGPVRLASFSSDGSRIVTVAGAPTLGEARVWDAATGRPVTQPLNSDPAANHATFSPDGQYVAISIGDPMGRSGELRICDATTGALVFEPLKHAAPVHHASFSPDGKRIVTASGVVYSSLMGELNVAGSARVWDPVTGKPMTPAMQHNGQVLKALFSPDGTRIVTSSVDHTARIWDAATGQPLTPPMKHDDLVRHVSFSRDGRFVVTTVGPRNLLAADRGYARVWDVKTGDPVTPRLEHHGHVFRADISPDSLHVITAGRDGAARIWKLDREERAVEELLTIGQVLSGHRSDTLSNPLPLEPERLYTMWQGLRSAYPQEFYTPGEGLVGEPESSPARFGIVAGNLVRSGSHWRYLDDGSDPGESWFAADFDDSPWPAGPSPLGYGEGDEAQLIRYGPDPRRKFTTAYFRQAFEVEDAAGCQDLLLGLLCDDGAAVYLNGTEVVRYNLRAGAGPDAFAAERIEGLGEETILYFPIDPGLLVSGSNLLAVEIHQATSDSTDVSFDLTLNTNVTPVLAQVLASSEWPFERSQAAKTLGRLGPAASSAVQPLRRASAADENPLVRSWAAAALMQIEPTWEAPPAVRAEPADETEAKCRQMAALFLNHDSWQVVRFAGRPLEQYAIALRAARTACALVPENGYLLNTLGVALYRTGDYSAAIETLEAAHRLLPVPHNLAFMAMAYQQLGQTDQARKYLASTRQIMQSASGKNQSASVFSLHEAKELIGDTD